MTMQNKRKGSARIAARDHASPRVSRSQKSSSENAQIADKKASQLITSSPRRQRNSGVPQKKNDTSLALKSVNTRSRFSSDACLDCDVTEDASFDCKGPQEGAAHLVLETIFSPVFHSARNGDRELADEENNVKFYQIEQEINHHRCSTEQLQVDVQNGRVVHETSGCYSVEEKSICENNSTSMSMTHSNYVEMDQNMCSENSDANNGDMMVSLDTNALSSQYSMDIEGASLSSEVSAIYFAMKNSKLECVDEHGQDTITTDVCVEDDDYDELDDFDPYFFIKNLPALSSVVPTFRRMLLPKQTRSCPSTTLVLDLDETLVHSTLEPCEDADFTFPVNFNLQEHTVYVRCRPHLRDFMERVSGLFEIIIFTASQSIYAEQLLNVLDPKRKVFRHRVYRDSCVYVEGNYLKDLSVLGRDLARVIIIDNSPQAFGFQVDNGIPIESWFDDQSDQELLRLLPFLESLVGVEDVRPFIAKKYNLREKIAAAAYPLNTRRADPFER